MQTKPALAGAIAFARVRPPKREASILSIEEPRQEVQPNRQVPDFEFDHVGAKRIGCHSLLAKDTGPEFLREAASILRNAARGSLVVPDEIGHGASTFDGVSIAWLALLARMLHASGCERPGRKPGRCAVVSFRPCAEARCSPAHRGSVGMRDFTMGKWLALAVLFSLAVGCGTTTPSGLGAAPGHWRPKAGTSWQWQLTGAMGVPLPMEVYDVDWQVDGTVLAALHDSSIRAICYVSVGSWEDWRPDASQFPAAVIGADYAMWSGEKYLDIRAPVVRALMEKRFDICKEKGFDAIEPDNMDVFELGAASGFPLTEADGIAYALWLAEAAHARGLGIGQKNAAGITGAIQSSYDWALSENCYSEGNWCPTLAPYLDADKPVFMCEYHAASFAAACAWAVPRKYSPILKSLDLGAPVTLCP